MADHEALSGAPGAFRTLAWVVLVATVVVIISGDIVQATESGAGCGENWPRCDGALLPSIEDAATGIEFAHRGATFVLSGLVLALYMFARRAFAAAHHIRAAMRWVVVFFSLEVGIGALLVAFGWVEDDASVGRVVADGLHVINTFFLVGAVALVVHYARGGREPRFRPRTGDERLLAAGVVALVLIAVSGAINSLADTLFPAGTLLEGIRDEFGAAAPFLVRIRAVHPVIAILGGVVIYSVARRLGEGALRREIRSLARFIQYAVGFQFAFGILNLALLTPLETQVVHLLAADVLWIAFLMIAWESGDASAEAEGARTNRREAVR